MSADLIIANGLTVTPHSTYFADIAVVGEKIAAIAPHGTLAMEGRTIDATSKIVVPGGIDPHIHSKSPLWAATGEITGYTGDVEQVSRAAVHGGTTMLIDFAINQPDESLAETVERREGDFRGKSYCDYAYHLWLNGIVSRKLLDELPGMIGAGYSSVKMFTTNVTPSRVGRKVPLGSIWEVLQRLADAGGIAAIHAEDDDLVMHMYDRLKEEGRTHFVNMAEVHSTLSEEISFRRIIRLAEHVEGAALYMMHVSSKAGVEAIAESRQRGFPIYGETLHQYALFSADDAYARKHGQIYHTYPSLKFDEDRRALWSGMSHGTIGSIGTDELCTTLQVKLHGDRIDDTTGGNSGVEPRMGIMFTEAVINRGFSLEKFADLTSGNAARYFGMYPQKGALMPGSDADICIIDPSAKFVLDNSRLHETDYSPWEGWKIEGWPTTTIVRGSIAVHDGELVGGRHGQWIARKVSEAIRLRP